MSVGNDSYSASWLTVKQMMNQHFRVLYLEDSLRTAIAYYQKYKLNTLPVVDEDENLIGVFPKKRLYKALLEGVGLDSPCKPYVIHKPISVSADLTYDEMSLVIRVTKSKVDNVVVVNNTGKVVGMIGTAEYLRSSLKVIMNSSALLESVFKANYEGIIIVDREGYILRINPAAKKMFMLDSSEIKGKHLRTILPEITLSDELCLGMKQTIKSVPVIVNQVPIVKNDAQIGTSIAILDVSNVEKIANELEIVKRLQTTLGGVLNASADGVFITDANGIIRYVNESACRLLNNMSKDIIEQPASAFLKTEKPVQTAKTGLIEVNVANIDGRNCIISHIPFMQDGSEEEIVGVVNTVYLDDNVLTEEIVRKWFCLNQQVHYYRDELQKRTGENNGFEQVVTKNLEFNKLKKDAKHIARSSSTILLTGESGVGKNLFAQAIHKTSPRANNPFIKVNCAAIPETLLESELFGYAPGSFTGASKSGKPGYFERAHKGTIFLDEIGDMPLSIQVKILQVLQDKEFTRVGGSSNQEVDVRIIAATNRDLREAIAKGTFREDLYYRLNVIEFYLPPLRERPEDIIPLAEMFIRKYNQILGSKVVGISLEAKKALEYYSWPGNIRELENAIERAANYVWEGEIGSEDLPPQIFRVLHKHAESLSYRGSLGDYEKEMLLEALNRVDGNKSAAARYLKISRSTLYEKLAKYGL